MEEAFNGQSSPAQIVESLQQELDNNSEEDIKDSIEKRYDEETHDEWKESTKEELKLDEADYKIR